MAGQNHNKQNQGNIHKNGKDPENQDNDESLSEEFDVLDSRLDQLDSALDFLEQKNDEIHQQLKELLQSNIDIRQQLRNANREAEEKN